MAGEAMFYGIGDMWAETNAAPSDIAENVMLPLQLFDFEFTQDATSIEAKAQKNGIKKVIASAIGEITGTVKLSTQFGNWSHLEFFLDQFSNTESSVAIPVLKSGTVPSSSAYEVSDAGITTGTASGIYVYVYDDQDSGYRTKAGTSSPDPGEVYVDTTNNKLVFNAADAGKTISYTLPVTHTSGKSLGGAINDQYGALSFYGTIYGPEWTIYFPNLTRKTMPSITLNGDVASLEVEFTANLVPGYDAPYKIYKF
jgi:hypothetical protein